MTVALARGIRDHQDTRPTDAFSVTRRNLTVSYLLALALVAIVLIGGGFIFSAGLDHMADDAQASNAAASQVALVNRVAALSADLSHTDAGIRQETQSAIALALQQVNRSHAALTGVSNAPAFKTPALRAHYFDADHGVDQAVRRLNALGDGMLAEPGPAGLAPEGMDSATVADARREMLGPISTALVAAVDLHEQANGTDRVEAFNLHKAIIAAALLLLLLEAVFIFMPMVDRASSLTAKLERESRVDTLTGLLNRRAVNKALADTMLRGESLAVVAIDLDHFKEANDAEGHDAGDALLRTAAERLRGAVRSTDVVGRIGGDEFAAFLLGVSEHEVAAQIAERIRAALHEPVEYRGRSLRLGATLGFAVAPVDSDNSEVILRVADEALIRAKRETRGSIGRASKKDADRLLRATAIVRAFDAGSLQPRVIGLSAHLQPILRIHGNAPVTAPVAFEALARWTHPDLGMVPPSELLDAIGPARTFRLGHEVRDHALAAFNALHARHPMQARLALNLSAGEVAREDIGLCIAQQVEASGVPLSLIDIEITEEVLLDRVSDRTLDQLAVLRERGVRLTLDDFGTGHSGLAQLLRIPLDAVKLDKQFIQRLGIDRRAEEIVRATVSLAKGLGVSVMAEGVETAEQATLAAQLGCDSAQGYLYARPMPMEALELWLADRADTGVRVLDHEAPLSA